MAQPSSATASRVQGGRRGGPRHLIWMSGCLFIVSMVRCAGEDEGSLTEWRQRNRVEAPEPDSRGSGAGSGWSDSLVEWRRQRNRVEPHARDGRGSWEEGGAGGRLIWTEMGGLIWTEWKRHRVEPHETDSRAASEAGGVGGQGDSAQGRGRSASLAEWRRQRNASESHERDGRGAWGSAVAGVARSRPCRGGEYTDGRWVAKAAGELEPAPCCHLFGPDEKTWLFWLKTCAISEGYQCKGWVDEYEWQPARCVLAAWDAAAFCGALRGRSLMFIGDSTMIEVCQFKPPCVLS